MKSDLEAMIPVEQAEWRVEGRKQMALEAKDNAKDKLIEYKVTLEKIMKLVDESIELSSGGFSVRTLMGIDDGNDLQALMRIHSRALKEITNA